MRANSSSDPQASMTTTTAPTAQYCVFGHPVAHSRSPWIHQRFAALTEQAMHYEAQLAPLDGFTASLQAFVAQGGLGCNITVPFKHEAAACAHSQSPRVALAGAANTLVVQADGRLHADNTDGLGLVADIQSNAARPLAGQRILLLGAGGAAAGVLGPLLEQRPHSIHITNRTLSKAQALVDSHSALAQNCAVPLQAAALPTLAEEADGFDILINATASSLQGQALDLPATLLRPQALAYDMMYGPAAQVFLDWASRHGAQGRDGLGMLVEQAAASFALWRGIQPPAAQVLAELRQLLADEATPAR